MSALRLQVEGIGVWSPQLADFAALGRVLEGAPPDARAARPGASLLPANERRRASPSVLLAMEVAQQAVAMSGRDAATLPCVFASADGDQATTDYMCATLAQTPTELSPTRFHNSVHNAPVGYWTIAVGCNAPSNAVAAQRATFGAALLEAACQVLDEQRAVLLVCADAVGSGPLLEVTGCNVSFGCALVLAPEAGTRALARLALQLGARQPESALAEPLAGWRAGNASAASLPLLSLLARGSGRCQLAASPHLGLQIDTESIE